MGSPSEHEVKLVEKVGAFFEACIEVLLTIVKVTVALVFSVVIGLALIKSFEMYNDAKLEFEAEVSVHQRLQ